MLEWIDEMRNTYLILALLEGEGLVILAQSFPRTSEPWGQTRDGGTGYSMAT